MSILSAYVVPHPPIIIPEVGHGEERKIAATTRAYQKVMERAAAHHPDVVIVISPHAVMYADYFHISPGKGASGSLAQFRAPNASATVEYDAPLAARIGELARERGLPAGPLGEKEKALDHGTLIPLLFLRQAGLTCPIVRIGLSGLSPLTHYRFGQCIADAVNALNRRAVLIASGDLSHKLTEEGPYGFAPEGPVFDRELTAAFASGDFGAMLAISPSLADAAAECGWRSFQIMAGALDRREVTAELLSYEGPFGVGYGVASFEAGTSNPARNYGDRFEQARTESLQKVKNAEDDYVKLARLSLETYVRDGRHTHLPNGLPAELTSRSAGVFVSLHKDGQLRGCIGTTDPTMPTVADEILQNAVSAGMHDPRFDPVQPDELDDLVYSVDVLGKAAPIDSPDALDPKRYGVIVQNGNRRGLLLPDLEGVDTAEEQIAIARRKASIREEEAVQLFRFEVVRHH